MFATEFSDSIGLALDWMGKLINSNTREMIDIFYLRAEHAEGFRNKRAWLNRKRVIEWDLNLVAGGKRIQAIKASDCESTGNPFQPTRRSVVFTLINPKLNDQKVVTLHLVECSREFDDHGEVDFRALRSWAVRAVEWKGYEDAVRTLELL